MSVPQIFEFEEAVVRVVTDDQGEPWWIGKDVCRCLDIKNTSDALSRLSKDERTDGVGITDPIGRQQNVVAVNEPGLYRLIFTSRTEVAERFKRWLAHEVLPALRRTGRYEIKPPPAARSFTPAPEAYREILPPMDDLPRLLAAVEECRRLKGSKKAWALWILLGFPDPDLDDDDPVALAERFREMRENGLPTGVVAASARRTNRSVQHYIRMLDALIPEALDALRSRDLSVTQARVLCDAPKEDQPELLQGCLSGEIATADDLQLAIRMAQDEREAADAEG